MNSNLHPCKVPPPKYDDLCCKAPKTFIDKYCAEQKLWREINCPRKCKPKCCPKGDPWDVCSKYFGYPNYDCMEAKNFRENNKTMAALTNCMKRTCANRTCQGPYYSMTGPVYHPPGWKCQDYSLYIPTERILKHCKCKGNHACLKKKKCNPFRAKMCSCPQGDCCCCSGSGPCCYPYDCLPCTFQCGQCSYPQDCCCNGNNGNDCYNNNNNNDTTQQQGNSSYDGQTGNLNSPTTYQNSQSTTAAPSQPFMFDVKVDENGRNRIEGAMRIGDLNDTNDHDPNCNCPMCNRREDPMSSGNHYPDCQCELCQRRRNKNYICPKITDRKGERCKKLWFGNYKGTECDQPPLASTLAQLLNNLPDSDTIECTGREDCPCAKCCKQRAYARIKPHHWYSNGLENPDMKFKRPPQLILNNDENNNLTDEISSSNNSSTRSPTNVKFSDNSDSSSGGHRDGNNNPSPPQRQRPQQPQQQQQGGPRGSKSEPFQAGGQMNSNNIENNDENSPPLDDDDDNMEPLEPCKPENPCRKSFGLGVMPKFPCCCNNKNNCNNNNNCCCCCNSMAPQDWGCCNPCEFQNMNNNCNNCCPQTAPCAENNGCENFDSGSYGTNSPIRKLRTGNNNYFFPKSSNGGDDGDNNNNRDCPKVQDEQVWAKPNDYNTTTYRQYFKRCKSKPSRSTRNPQNYRGSRSSQNIENNNSTDCFDSMNYPPDDDGWCCGKPRYRRGRKFNEDCQVYPTETNSFRIFADLDKRIAQCQRCEQDYEPTRICHDRSCRMPLSYEIRENTEKKRRYCDEESRQICSQNCNMLDRYCNCCQD